METAAAVVGYTLMLAVDSLAASLAWRRRRLWARPGFGPMMGTALAFLFGVVVLPYYLLRIALRR